MSLNIVELGIQHLLKLKNHTLKTLRVFSVTPPFHPTYLTDFDHLGVILKLMT